MCFVELDIASIHPTLPILITGIIVAKTIANIDIFAVFIITSLSMCRLGLIPISFNKGSLKIINPNFVIPSPNTIPIIVPNTARSID